MKLKIVINKSEMLALASVLQKAAGQNTVEDMEDKLVLAALQEFWVKVQTQAFVIQKQYSLSLRPTWAIAMHIQFSGNVDRTSYEGNLIQKICDKIHQKIQ